LPPADSIATSALAKVTCRTCAHAGDILRHSCQRQPLCGDAPLHTAVDATDGHFVGQACDVAVAKTAPLHVSRYEAHCGKEGLRKGDTARTFTEKVSYVAPNTGAIPKLPYLRCCHGVCGRSLGDELLLLRMKERLTGELATFARDMASKYKLKFPQLPRREFMLMFNIASLAIDSCADRRVIFIGQLVRCNAQSGPHPARQVFLRMSIQSAVETGDAPLQSSHLAPVARQYVESVRSSAQVGGALYAGRCGALDMYTTDELVHEVLVRI